MSSDAAHANVVMLYMDMSSDVAYAIVVTSYMDISCDVAHAISVFVNHVVIVFWGPNEGDRKRTYIPRLFSEYMLTFRVE